MDQPFYNATDVSIARDMNNDEFLERRETLRKEVEEQKAEEERQAKLKEAKEKLLSMLD